MNNNLGGDSSGYIMFSNSFNINKNERKDFYNWLNEREIEFVEDEIYTDWEIIENRIKAEIVSARWGKNYKFKTYIEVDEQVNSAFKYFNDARSLMLVH